MKKWQLKTLLWKNITVSKKTYLEHFWNQSALNIKGDDDLAIATKYNIYQLLQSVGKDEYSNMRQKV